jgi:hypothetical protein
VTGTFRDDGYADVIVFWVESELEKEAILADASLAVLHDIAL